jgi:transposase-like protein
MYLYRAIDSNGDTVEFWFSERRDLIAAKRFLRKALKRNGRPERIAIDGSQTNREAICRMMLRAGCRIVQDAGSSRSGSGKVPTSIIVSSRIIGLSSGGFAR